MGRNLVSHLDDSFLEAYKKLPKSVRQQARKAYQLWKQNPNHPSLQFKLIDRNEGIYSVRVSYHWRALGLREGNVIAWFWIGSHEEYNHMV